MNNKRSLRRAKRSVVLWLTLTVAVLMQGSSWAEESSILEGSTVNFVIKGNPASNVIDGAFKTYVYTSYESPTSPGDGSKEIGVHLSSEMRIVSAFVVNNVYSLTRQKGQIKSALYVGNDSSHFSPVLTKCSPDFHDTCF